MGTSKEIEFSDLSASKDVHDDQHNNTNDNNNERVQSEDKAESQILNALSLSSNTTTTAVGQVLVQLDNEWVKSEDNAESPFPQVVSSSPKTTSTGDGQLPVSRENGSFKSEDNAESQFPRMVRSSAPKTTCTVVGQLLVSIALGFVFGVALEKSRVFEPKSIRLQMVFERWVMMKMFLAALASSQLSLGLLSVLPFSQGKFRQASGAYFACLNNKGILTSCIGPFVLGVGMTVSGACPGMVLAQVGAWVPNAIFTLVGCLTAALLYGMVAPQIESCVRPKKPIVHQQVHSKFHKPFALFAIPMAVAIGTAVVLLEVFIDYRDELEHPDELSSNIVRTIAWPPYVGGILIGVLQIPMVLLLEDTLGGSSSFVTLTSQWVVTPQLQKKFPYLARMRTGVGNWWQVLYVGGAILGGLSSAAASDSLAESQGVGALEAFFGGLLMLSGARFGGGCTSGHGLSGASLLAWLSFLAVPCMFGGAISTAFIMRAADNSLDRLVNSTLTM